MLEWAFVFLSQRDCVFQPRVARHALPWETGRERLNPNGVVARQWLGDATPLGLEILRANHPG